MDRDGIVEREQLVKIKAHDEKNNPGHGILELECLESWRHEMDCKKTWNTVTNFTDSK